MKRLWKEKQGTWYKAKGGGNFKKPPPPPPTAGQNPQGEFQPPAGQMNFINGSPQAYELKRKAKLTLHELTSVNSIHPTAPKFLNWSHTKTNFNRYDHPASVPSAGRYPLIVDPTIRSLQVTRCLLGRGSGLNILFLKTFNAMKIPIDELRPSIAPLQGFIPTVSMLLVGQITLPVTFGTLKNYKTERLCFEVLDIEAPYHAILGRPGILKFMAVPHYAYLLLKIPRPAGVLTVCGNTLRAYECEQEACSIAQSQELAIEATRLRLEVASIQESP
jgi:hypothetical protein